MSVIRKNTVIHLVPSDGLGGVEAAARSLDVKEYDNIKVWFMSGHTISSNKFSVEVAPKEKVGSLSSYILTFLSLLRVRPSLLVCSLWRSTLVGIFYKLCFPWKKLVIMLHSQRYAHWADKLVTNIGLRVCNEVWCDSQATRNCLLSKSKRNDAKVLSFLLKVNADEEIDRSPLRFVYWGRLVKKKRVGLAVKIFSEINKKFPSADFLIYGPDGGDRASIKKEISALGLEDSVKLMGNKPTAHFDKSIRSASFFLNPSTHEGMGVAVIEAMQLGIIPVVTPVGEIKHYCDDGYNALVFEGDIETAVEKILSALESGCELSELSINAQSTWLDKPDYTEDFKKHCSMLLN